MRLPVRCLEITSMDASWSEMERIGVDPVGIRIMAPKQFHYNLRLSGLTPAEANILKQDMLSIGGEAAVARGAASCSVPDSGAVLSGTLKQYAALVEKLKLQSFGLPEVAFAISTTLDNVRKRRFLIKGRGRDWAVDGRTLIMGIVNVTPDSFSDKGAFLDKDRAVERALTLAGEGADWIDVGGESTRPGAGEVPVEEELRRVVPVVEALSSKGLAVSVDTTKADVALASLEAGASVINDVSALGDERMAEVCARFKCPVILMHRRGGPKEMQKDVGYEDLMGEVFSFLSSRLDRAVSSGIDRESVVLDPGIGFGKSASGNVELLRRLKELKSLGRPVLVGASRKSFLGAIAGEPVEGRLSASVAACTAAVLNGAGILRVHDVKESVQAARIAEAVRDSGAAPDGRPGV